MFPNVHTTTAIPNVHFESSISLSDPLRTAFLHLDIHNIFEFVVDHDWSPIKRILSFFSPTEYDLFTNICAADTPSVTGNTKHHKGHTSSSLRKHHMWSRRNTTRSRSLGSVRSPAGTTAENIFIWWPPDNMWWPPDSDVVASGHALHRYMVATTYLHKKNKEYHIHRYLVATR